MNKEYTAICTFYTQITNGKSSILNKPEKRTPFRLVALKGDEMFRSIWENGERGTPEQWRN